MVVYSSAAAVGRRQGVKPPGFGPGIVGSNPAVPVLDV